MQTHLVTRPETDDDSDGARRALEEFAQLYHPTLMAAKDHLHMVISGMEPEYADAYKPWHTALNEITRGIHLLNKKIPLPDMKRFLDALYMFTFEGAIQFLYDLCIACKIRLHRQWEKDFREHIQILLFSIAILNREQAVSQTR